MVDTSRAKMGGGGIQTLVSHRNNLDPSPGRDGSMKQCGLAVLFEEVYRSPHGRIWIIQNQET